MSFNEGNSTVELMLRNQQVEAEEKERRKKEEKRKKKEKLVKTYTGKQSDAVLWLRRDAEKMAEQGYFPISDSYVPGAWGNGDFIVALILCFVLIGILIFIYMIIVKPAGTLTVTYEYQGVQSVNRSTEKVCPMCAETVKGAAKICRFCGHKF